MYQDQFVIKVGKEKFTIRALAVHTNMEYEVVNRYQLVIMTIIAGEAGNLEIFLPQAGGWGCLGEIICEKIESHYM